MDIKNNQIKRKPKLRVNLCHTISEKILYITAHLRVR